MTNNNSPSQTKHVKKLKAKKTRKYEGSTTGRGIKTRFVLSFPFNAPALDIVQAAATEGIEITPSTVHNVRASARAKTMPAPRLEHPNGGVTSQRAGTILPMTPELNPEPHVRFRALVVEIGIARARELMRELETGFNAIVDGVPIPRLITSNDHASN